MGIWGWGQYTILTRWSGGGDQEDEEGKNFLTEQVKICRQIWVFGGGDSTPFSQDGVGGGPGG